MRIQIINELKQTDLVNLDKDGASSGWVLCFQKCRYVGDKDGSAALGYRFIWRTPKGHLQPARGQARIPSIKLAKQFMDQAIADGWGIEEF
jgi:hypothetical protein